MKKLLIGLFALGSLSISAYGNTALVLIDMQSYFVTRGGQYLDETNKEKFSDLISHQAEAMKEAMKFNLPILIVEFDINKNYKVVVEKDSLKRKLFTRKSRKTNKRLLSVIKDYNNVKLIRKSNNGMLSSYNTLINITGFFKLNDVTNLIIMGANGGACVRASIQDVIGLGDYVVYAYSKGIADFNSKEFIYPYRDTVLLNSEYEAQYKTLNSLNEVVDIMQFPESL